jgi:hypothetical protein
MKKLLICLLFLSCGRKSDYEIYTHKYDSTLMVIDTQVKLGNFYLQRGRETENDSFLFLADSVVLEAEKSLIVADSFYRKAKGYEVHRKLGDSLHNIGDTLQ